MTGSIDRIIVSERRRIICDLRADQAAHIASLDVGVYEFRYGDFRVTLLTSVDRAGYWRRVWRAIRGG